MGIGPDGRSARLEQALDMARHEGAAMAPADELGVADRLVDAPRARRQVRERVARPGVRIVILGISEGAAVKLDDPGADVGIRHRLLEEAQIVLRAAPPFDPMRAAAPLAEQGEVGRTGAAKTILGVHGPL
jgi:hypothetical protein